jgi:hypothetical protein
MPTKREREYYRMGFQDGQRAGMGWKGSYGTTGVEPFLEDPVTKGFTKKRKLSAWNKYVKANSKKPRFRYRNGKLNLKKMAVAFRKTPAGKKKRR